VPAAARTKTTAAPRRTRLDPDQRRALVLDHARLLFSEQHYTAVSLDAVARAAGVTRGLVSHYFGTKRELYLAVVREMFSSVALPQVPEYVAGDSPEQRLSQSVDAWLDMSWQNRSTLLGAIGAGGLGSDPDLEEILERVSERAVDNIIQILGIGRARDASPELRALLRSFGGLAQEATREWLVRNRLTREQIHALLTSSLLWLTRDALPDVTASAPPKPRKAGQR
jgi:AcrR family transcriptional regulator